MKGILKFKNEGKTIISYTIDGFDYYQYILKLTIQEFNKEIKNESYYIDIKDGEPSIFIPDDELDKEEDVIQIIEVASEQIQSLYSGPLYMFRLLKIVPKTHFFNVLDLLTYIHGVDDIMEMINTHLDERDILQNLIYKTLVEIKEYRDL